MSEWNTTRPAASPVVVALDTSTAAMSMSIVRGREMLGEVQSMAERNHSVEVVTKLQQLMASCGVEAETLDAIAVGRGPGSYTGMRIGVTVAKTLAWAWAKPIVGVSSLEALAYGSRPATESGVHWVVPIMDARRGQVYTAAFASGTAAGSSAEEACEAMSGNTVLQSDNAIEDGGGWKRLKRDGIRLMSEWVDALAERVKEASGDESGNGADSSAADAVELAGKTGMGAPSSAPASLGLARAGAPASIIVCGELSKHEEEAARLRQLCEAAGVRVELVPTLMEGRSVALLGMERVLRGERDDVHDFVPNYTQLTEAEVKLKEKQAERDEP